jgi:hypothetical protein
MLFLFGIMLSILSFGLYIGVRVVAVRHRAFRENLKQVSVFGDFLHIITWGPNEVVVMMRNKAIQPSSQRVGKRRSKNGGSKLISPFWGHEVFARMFLSRIETIVDLNDLLSYDKIRVNLNVRINWKVINVDAVIEEFCVGNSDYPESQGEDILNRAGDFLSIKAEKTVRGLVSKKSVALPALAKMNKSLEILDNKLTGIQVRFPLDANNPFEPDIDDILKINLEGVANEYGISIDEVILGEKLPQNIQSAIEATWQSSLLPVTIVHEAIAKEIEFRTMENLMGTDATTVNELLKNFHGAPILGHLPFINALLEMLYPNLHGSQGEDTKIKILKRNDYDGSSNS